MTLSKAQQERERYRWVLNEPKNDLREIAVVPESEFLRTQFMDLYAKIGLRPTEKEFYKMAWTFNTYVVKKDGHFVLLKDFLASMGLGDTPENK